MSSSPRRPPSGRSEIAQLVRAARTRAGLTQEQLAFRMTQLGEPTDRRQVGDWESGKQMPGAYKFLLVLRSTALSASARKTQAERDIEDVEAQLWAILDRLRDVQPRRQQDD